MCRDYGASSSVSKIHGPGSRIGYRAFSWRRQGACSGKHLRWAHTVGRALRPVRRGGSSMVNQSPRTARGAFFATRVLNFSSVPLTLSCLVEVWPRKFGAYCLATHSEIAFHLCMNASCVHGYVSAKYFFPKSRSGEPCNLPFFNFLLFIISVESA
jgi:hypothetical protein